MDAYWSPAALIRAPSACPAGLAMVSVSTMPNRAGSSRGGATGYSQKQANAIAVASASVVRALA
jgi:hypothetical protein